MHQRTTIIRLILTKIGIKQLTSLALRLPSCTDLIQHPCRLAVVHCSSECGSSCNTWWICKEINTSSYVK